MRTETLERAIKVEKAMGNGFNKTEALKRYGLAFATFAEYERTKTKAEKTISTDRVAEVKTAVRTFLDLPFTDAQKVQFMRSLF